MEGTIKLVVIALLLGYLVYKVEGYLSDLEEKNASDVGSVGGMDTESTSIIGKIPPNKLAINKAKLLVYPIIPIVDALKKATGYINTDEVAIYTALKSIPNKLVLQTVSNYYQGLYGESLSSLLADQLDTEELSKASKILDKLPNDFTSK